jgi:hypothetical protein
VDTVVCTCNAGYYGSGTSCSQCKQCGANEVASNVCSGRSATDTTVCNCATGFYRSGTSCLACSVCSQYASVATGCTATANAKCTCNSGYFGDGATCSPCTPCAAGQYSPTECSTSDYACEQCPSSSCSSGQYIQTACAGTSVGKCAACTVCGSDATAQGVCDGTTTADIKCVCAKGYFWAGDRCSPCSQQCDSGSYIISECTITSDIVCKACKECGVNADRTGECTGAGKVDSAMCTCSQGFYGTGMVCNPCRAVCSSDATATAACTATHDIKCTCNTGFFGNGLTCSPCSQCAAGLRLDSKCTSSHDSVCVTMAAAATSASAAAAFSELTMTPDATAAAAAVPAAAVVHLALVFRVSLTDFNLTEQQRLKESLALAAGLTRADAQLVTLSIRAVTVDSRRTADSGTEFRSTRISPAAVLRQLHR